MKIFLSLLIFFSCSTLYAQCGPEGCRPNYPRYSTPRPYRQYDCRPHYPPVNRGCYPHHHYYPRYGYSPYRPGFNFHFNF